MLKSERVLISEGIEVTPPLGHAHARSRGAAREPERERKWARARLVVLLSVFMTRLFADIMSKSPFGPLRWRDRTGAYLRVKGTVAQWVLIRR